MKARFWVAAAGLTAVALLMGTPAALAQPAQPAAGAESTGWAGYYLSGADGAFTSISAGFAMPTAKCTSGDQDVAFWVGLDGVSSDSVEQIGVMANCTGGTASYTGWYEMYPGPPEDFTNAIDPGDSLSASVTFSGTDTYTLVLSDSTQGWTRTVTQKEAGLARSSAEVITSGPGADGSSPTLTDFGKVTYSGCKVNGTSMGSQDPTPVTMVDDKGNVMVSTSAITEAGKFSNTWVRGN